MHWKASVATLGSGESLGCYKSSPNPWVTPFGLSSCLLCRAGLIGELKCFIDAAVAVLITVPRFADFSSRFCALPDIPRITFKPSPWSQCATHWPSFFALFSHLRQPSSRLRCECPPAWFPVKPLLLNDTLFLQPEDPGYPVCSYPA